MATTYPKMGNKILATVIGKQGDCALGIDIGDEFEL
jgi:hypothetical protein